MPNYRVQIEGSNFLADMNGKIGKHGFITFCCLQADDGSAAENAAVQMVRDDQELRDLVKNQPDDPPVMDILEITELESLDGVPAKTGRIWYEMKPKRWWQLWRR